MEEQEVPTDGGEELIPQISNDGDGKVMKPGLMMTQGKSKNVMRTRALGSLTTLKSLKMSLTRRH